MSEENLKDLFEAAPFGIYTSTLDGRLTSANAALARMFGYGSAGEMVGSVYDLAAQLFVEPARRNAILRRVASSENFVMEEVKYRSRDGRLFDGLLQMRSVRNQKGEIERLEGFLQDITGIKEKEKKFEEANDLNALLVRAMPFGMNIVDGDGRVLFSNEEMKRLVGGNVAGEHCWEVSRDDKKKCNDCPIASGLGLGEARTRETQGVFGGRTFQVTSMGLLFKGRKAALEIFEDITDKKKLQLELSRAQRLQSIGTLASGIAHDFNNLLGIIIGYATLLEGPADDREKTLNRVRTIIEAAERGTALVRQMLVFGRQAEPVFSAVSTNRLINELVKMLSETFPKSIRVLCNLAEDIPMVNGDPTQMHQVLLNLCVNARDAIATTGDIILSTEVVPGELVHRRFPAASASEYVLVGVSDNGAGMSKEVMEHVFEPFFTTKKPGKGTGLGLSVVFGIVEDHHGFIDVQSAPGKGSSFWLYFPVYPQAPASSETLDESTESAPGGNETVLVIEDEEMLNELAASTLSGKGYRVLRSYDGREAVGLYKRNMERIDLVLSDFGLPKLTGGEVLTWLKEVNPRVKFMLATGYIDPEERAAVIENGAAEIVSKPYRPAELLKKVRKVLDSR